MSDDLPQILESMQAHGYKLVVVYVGDDLCPPMPEGVILHEIGGSFEGLEFSNQRDFRQFATLTVTGD